MTMNIPKNYLWNIVCAPVVANMATVRNLEVISDRFNVDRTGTWSNNFFQKEDGAAYNNDVWHLQQQAV
jgi:hypothetical protein